MTKQVELIALLEMALEDHDSNEGVSYDESHWSYRAGRLLYPGYHDKIEEESKRLAGLSWDKFSIVGITGTAAERGFYVDKRKGEYISQAKANIGDISKFKVDPDDGFNMRFEILLQLIHGVNRSKDKEWSLGLIHTVITNAIYLNLNGTHEERVAKMNALNIPESAHAELAQPTPQT